MSALVPCYWLQALLSGQDEQVCGLGSGVNAALSSCNWDRAALCMLRKNEQGVFCNHVGAVGFWNHGRESWKQASTWDFPSLASDQKVHNDFLALGLRRDTAQVQTRGEKAWCVLGKLVLPISASYAATQKKSDRSHATSMGQLSTGAFMECLLYGSHGSRLIVVNKREIFSSVEATETWGKYTRQHGGKC